MQSSGASFVKRLPLAHVLVVGSLGHDSRPDHRKLGIGIHQSFAL